MTDENGKPEGTPPRKQVAAGCATLLVLGIVVASCFSSLDGDPEPQLDGSHCLELDGSHPEVVWRLKRELNDAESFEHVQTLVNPVTDQGTHTLVMRYRAANLLGALVLTDASAQFRNADCVVFDFVADLGF